MKAVGRVVLAAVVTLLFATMGTGTANANLLVNGSFELGTYAGGAWTRVAAGDSTTITGWTVGGAGIDWHNTDQMYPQVDGTKVVDLNLDEEEPTGPSHRPSTRQ